MIDNNTVLMFGVEVGDLPVAKATQYMEQTLEKLKETISAKICVFPMKNGMPTITLLNIVQLNPSTKAKKPKRKNTK